MVHLLYRTGVELSYCCQNLEGYRSDHAAEGDRESDAGTPSKEKVFHDSPRMESSWHSDLEGSLLSITEQIVERRSNCENRHKIGIPRGEFDRLWCNYC